ncbi:MAG: zinc metalloprotease HtpX [Candidatus Nanohaloarchaea archaeon]|nr:zinc metalloprotease HtpX [Candidatus Nanohaloarchaea archaeon]
MNTARLAGLFAVLVALFGGLGYLFMGVGGLVMGLLLAGAMNFASYFYSDRIVTKMHGARKLERSEAPELHEMTENLADKAGIPVPDLYVMDNGTPNAFATGRNPDNAIVCVTSGLLNTLSQDEVEGVVAHELSHVKNRDTLIQTVAGTLAGGISLVAQMLAFGMMDDEGGNPLVMLGGLLLAPLAASMIKMAISRSREFSADATAATMTDPGNLASGLRTIESSVSRSPMKNGARGASHMFIVNPFRGESLAKLFSTHPPTEERIRRLEQMQGN